jgi:hypothetical protein
MTAARSSCWLNANAKEDAMPRFMLFMYPVISDEEYAAGPSVEDVEEMMRYNEELSKAGALLALDGLHGEATRVGKSSVTDGPFSEAKELVGGYWVIQAKDREEAVEWARRVPLTGDSFVEVRQIQELTDFPEDIQAVGKLSQEPPNQTSAA